MDMGKGQGSQRRREAFISSARQNPITEFAPAGGLCSRASLTKNKNYQTNPFCDVELSYNHNNLCARCTEPQRKTNPFGPHFSTPKSPFPIIPSHSNPCGGPPHSLFRVCSMFSVRRSMFDVPQTSALSVPPWQNHFENSESRRIKPNQGHKMGLPRFRGQCDQAVGK